MIQKNDSELLISIEAIEKFISDGFYSIAIKEKEKNANHLLLAIKKQNLKIIQNFKKQALQKIAYLEEENTLLHRYNFDIASLPISEFKPKTSLSEIEKEAMRIDSITQAKINHPELF